MFRRKRPASDFNAEIEAHLQLEIERLQEEGLNEEEALELVWATEHFAFELQRELRTGFVFSGA